jgi:hypothetical protein
VLAARKLGLAEVPVIELRHLTPAQRKAYILADNKLALNAGWDADLLRLELADLQELGFDLELTGFDADEIAGFLAEPTTGLTDPDEIPSLPETPVTRVGDVWILGRHRLACGDCTDPIVVQQVLAGVRPHLMVTDPPRQHEPAWYAVRGQGHWSGDRKQTTLWQIAGRSEDAETVHGTQKPVECMRRPIENNSSPGQAVYEPFSGSGTTIIAAEMTGRACHAIELSPAYVDVAIARWEAFTGQEAVREDDGALFSGLAPSPTGGAPASPAEASHAPV